MAPKQIPLSIELYASNAKHVVLGNTNYALWYGVENNLAVAHIWQWCKSTRTWSHDFELPAGFVEVVQQQHGIKLVPLEEEVMA